MKTKHAHLNEEKLFIEENIVNGKNIEESINDEANEFIPFTNNKGKKIPDNGILLFKSCLISTEYPGVESSTKFVFDKLGIEYIIDHDQSCCTGLGHYSDVFDQYSTTLIAARNFDIALKDKHPNIATMCATCYAINKKASNILNNDDEIRNKINKVFTDCGLKRKYEKGSIDSKNNIFHVAEIIYNKKNEIKEYIDKKLKNQLSNLKIATHHACHYCKVHYNDTIAGVTNPNILDELVESCGYKTIGWFNEKRTTCGAGFRQRFVNKELSLSVTEEKLLSLYEEDVDILIHMCPNCHMQFDRYQPYISKNKNKPLKTMHLNIVQFIAILMGADIESVVGIQTHTVKIKFLEKSD
ncbi:ferredoxin:CoB-CoM heterodisulfide reductase subunit HdrB [Methanobrevibacter curvatus]|uniref:Lactate utilization protein A n=1 Tax=Methanobrevibacter curvatus TaxID=49547 RepID=A0A165ZT79_9EURY|nr:ferredoxin:CoB-CoM heterodisulfide reductase subunit HdrB [Methanobrevibacter curvatus]KZX11129.1 lactate utilization protein A [Methanobrevibacter curvatus]